MKRVIAVFLSMLFLLTALPMGALSVAAEYDPILTLTEGIAIEDRIENDIVRAYYFKPDVSGYYAFYSISEYDTVGSIQDMNGYTLADDDDGGDYLNFRVTCFLNAGKTYWLEMSVLDADNVSFCVCVEKVSSDLRVGEVAEALVVESEEAVFSFTPEVSDYYVFYSMAEDEDTRAWIYDPEGNEIAADDDGGEGNNFFTICWMNADETYWMTARYWGSRSGSFPVCIERFEPDPVIGLGETVEAVIDPESGEAVFYFIPEESGYYAFYSMAVDTDTVGRIENVAGAVLANNDDGGEELNFRAVEYMVEGNIYRLCAWLYEYGLGSFPVHVEPCEPRMITGVEFLDQSLGSDEIRDYVQARVEAIYSNGGGCSWDCTHYINDDVGDYAIYETYSVPKEEWTAGNVYTVTASVNVNGTVFTGTYTITVMSEEDSIIKSVEIAPIRVIEEENGHVEYHEIWDEEQGEYVLEPYFYYYEIHPEYTDVVITLIDGSVRYGIGFNWNGQWFSIQTESQSYENRLLPGINERWFSIAGYEGTYTVEVVPKTANDFFEYTITDSGVIITDCYLYEDTLEIPATIDGLPVVGVADLGDADWYVEHLILPDSVETIGYYLLSDLKSVSFGAGIHTLDPEMFAWCHDLQSITVSAANPYFCIVDGALYDKAKTTFIAYPMGGEDLSHTLPATATNLDAVNYDIYSNLTISVAAGHPTMTTVDGVTYTKDMTRVLFCDKNKAGAYVMPNSVTSIADAAFANCDALTAVTIAPSVTSIVYRAFEGCGLLASVTLPQSLVSIDAYAFRGTPSLQSIDLPNGLTTIGGSAFASSGLTSLTLPHSVREVYGSAFSSSQITTVDLGSVEYLGGGVFANTPLRSVVIPDTVTYLGGSAFYCCYDLRSAILGKGLTAIQDETFALSGLESIDIPSNIRDIWPYAFENCDSLEQVTLNEGLENIYDRTFRYCSALREIVIPDSVTYLGPCAFEECASLTRAVLGAGITFVDEYTFDGCPLETLEFRGSLTSIGRYAFRGGNMTDLILPDSVTSIMYGAFQDCAPLINIQIPASVMDLGHDTFDGTAWYDVQPEGVTYLEHIAYDWKGVMPPETALAIPEDITVLADASFARQPNLMEADLPESLRVIGDYAFYEDVNLTTLYLGSHVEWIQEAAFYGCDGLTDVYYTGSEADREAINIEWDNEPLLNATWHYNYTDHVHTYDNACDPTCNGCGEVREVEPHNYTSRVTAAATCGVAGVRTYTCTVCGDSYTESIPATGAHTYSNDCDASCNVCDKTRTAPHVYDDACDATCNACGVTRTPPHQYADPYDGDCDLCGHTRPVNEFQIGDINGDGKLNIRDLGLLQQYLNNWDVSVSTAAADVNGDGKLNIRDLGVLQQYLNGWDVTFGK